MCNTKQISFDGERNESNVDMSWLRIKPEYNNAMNMSPVHIQSSVMSGNQEMKIHIENDHSSGSVVTHHSPGEASNFNHNSIQEKLEEAHTTIHTLKRMLLQSYDSAKKRNMKRDMNEHAAKVAKICRDVIWPKVKFAPESAFSCLAKDSIYDLVVNNCNLPPDEDKLIFWCNNKDIVRDSLHQHRSNVTSRIKVQFQGGKCS